MFVKTYPAETTEAFCDALPDRVYEVNPERGHVSAFTFFGGVPQSILYDNTRIAVAHILGTSQGSTANHSLSADKTRIRTRRFSELQSYYLFDDKFCRPARGNDKGKVESMIGYVPRNFMVPAPHYDSFDDLNAHLEQKCLARQSDKLRGHSQTIGERLVSDLDALMPLPVAEYEACDHVSTRARSTSMVRYKNNDYSVPVAYAHHDVQVRGFVHKVIIGCGNEIIAHHKRSYAKADMIYDPLHFLPLLEQKVGALDQAAPLQGWDLPDVFATIRRLLEARMGTSGKREYVQVLRLLETYDMVVVRGAIEQAIDLGAIGYDAIKHLVLCRARPRVALRQANAKPVFDDPEVWLQLQLPEIFGKFRLAVAIRYELNRMPKARASAGTFRSILVIRERIKREVLPRFSTRMQNNAIALSAISMRTRLSM